MVRTILVTGTASGIGKATAERLRDHGHTVIGVDVGQAEIEADLGTAEGRASMIAAAGKLAPGGLDGVVACAGIGNPQKPLEIISVNYFGAIATLEGLRPLLARSKSPRAVAICSTSGFLPGNDDVVRRCLDGDEQGALTVVSDAPQTAYPDSKRALGLWLRRASVHADWAAAGICLNGVAPGLIGTGMTEAVLKNPVWADVVKRTNPVVMGAHGEPDEIAEAVEALVCMQGRWMVGQIIYVDGGTDAILRPDRL